MPDGEDTQLMWLEEDGDDESTPQEEVSAQAVQRNAAPDVTVSPETIVALEDELQRTRKELMDVRKELAAKTVQLSRKEVIVSQEKVAELAAHVASEKDKQLASLAAHVEQLEMVLSQKEEELEEGRRLYNAQKRALREALAAAAEAEAVERQADEARARTAEAQVVEEELDRLQHELALLQARYHLEMRARDAELQSLKSELQAANANRKQAVAAAEAALTEAWQAELSRATEEAGARVTQLEAELARVRQQLEDHERSGDTMALAGELASLNQQKVAIQREFDAFRELASTTTREHREAAARLMEENAALKGRLAARAFQDVQAGFKPQSKVFTALTGPLGSGSGGPQAATAGVGLGPGNAWMEQLPAVLARLERQRKGLLPALAVGGVVVFVLLVAIIRAAAVTRSEHSGGLCFLAHLGIKVGPGCTSAHGHHGHPHTMAEAAGEELGHLLEQAPRVHDLEAVAVQTAAAAEAAAAEVAQALRDAKDEREAWAREDGDAAEAAAEGQGKESDSGEGSTAAVATAGQDAGAVDAEVEAAAGGEAGDGDGGADADAEPEGQLAEAAEAQQQAAEAAKAQQQAAEAEAAEAEAEAITEAAESVMRRVAQLRRRLQQQQHPHEHHPHHHRQLRHLQATTEEVVAAAAVEEKAVEEGALGRRSRRGEVAARLTTAGAKATRRRGRRALRSASSAGRIPAR